MNGKLNYVPSSIVIMAVAGTYLVRIARRHRRLLAFTSFVVFCVSCMLYSSRAHYLREKAFLDQTLVLIESSNSLLTATNGSKSASASKMACSLPDPDKIDARDPSIAKYIVPMESHFTCPKHDLDTTSSVDTTTGRLTIHNVGKNKCYYQSYKRTEEPGDVSIQYSKMVLIKNNTLDLDKLGVEFVFVKCYNLYHTLIYTRSHVNPLKSYMSPEGNDDQDNEPNQPSRNRLNVFILMIESLSRITFNRFLPKTKQALYSDHVSATSKVFDLKGLVKIADNSYPNMVALLTG